jgi:hypothetical protein
MSYSQRLEESSSPNVVRAFTVFLIHSLATNTPFGIRGAWVQAEEWDKWSVVMETGRIYVSYPQMYMCLVRFGEQFAQHHGVISVVYHGETAWHLSMQCAKCNLMPRPAMENEIATFGRQVERDV